MFHLPYHIAWSRIDEPDSSQHPLMPDLTLPAIVARILSSDRTEAKFTKETFPPNQKGPGSPVFSPARSLHVILTTFPPVRSVRRVVFSYAPGWKVEYVRLIPRLFPEVRELLIGSKQDRTQASPVFVQDVIHLMWELPLEVVELYQVSADKTRAYQLPRGGPVSGHTLRVWKVRMSDRVFGEATWELFPNVEVYHDTHLPFSVLPRWSRLKELVSMVIVADTNLCFVHPGLEKFSFLVAMRRRFKTWSIGGSAPMLKQFKFESLRFLRIEGIPEMLAACKHLEVIDINCVDSWKIVWEVTREWDSARDTKLIVTDNFSSLSEVERWYYIVEMVQEGRNLHPSSVFGSITEERQFDDVKSWLYEVSTELKKDRIGDYFWKLDAGSLAPFVHLKIIEFSNVDAITTAAFDTITSSLSHLQQLLLTASPGSKNREFTAIRLQSNSLQTLILDGFVCLQGYEFLSHSLRTLEINNCGHHHDCILDDATVEYHPNFGNFGELLLRDLLDESPSVCLPTLSELTISHESTGAEVTFAGRLLVDVTCQAGHPSLEKLTLYNCAHIHALRLTELPRLVELNVTYEENLFKGLPGSVQLGMGHRVLEGTIDLPFC
ncbi:hypothetical protein K493DRAFT_382411 [Basidiobolus meristosporus CBS 931.73]|uniref:RNI-like protein n=1 Tax=Basidiobolus meristosporus CBS 931.73 TaxID=1314790 RepID=A0A1Y1Z0A2_9FUNG|nr:hypothetical protein K493DRAFT_382411 [Basidiobolus meristosporus CBS 931.73]|eukprot:ORY03720.1 hypothetical protein K493DRAFT_382411 [Basidiobolus meristosporus CBS 931.73]